MSALVFADRKKFETLPSEVQKLVEGLTPLQFNKLRVSLSGFDHFDFMQLPLEIREMIYKYWVLTSGVFSTSWAGSYDNRVVPHPILSVSKAICSEVQSVMYRNTTFRHSFEMKNYRAGAIEKNYQFAFRQFRNVELGLTPLGWHIHDDEEEEKDLPHLLRSLVNILALRDHLLETSLKLTFVNRTATPSRRPTSCFAIHYHKSCSHGLFEPCQRGLPGTDEEQLEELKAAWMRAQFLHLVNNFRATLANKGLNFITVITNVEQTGHNVRVQRINEFTVKFRNLNTGKEGVMKCGDAGRKIKVKYGTKVGALDNLV